MKSYALVMRLPSGTEFWHTGDLPEVGDLISHLGREHLVVACEQPNGDERFVTRLAETSTPHSVPAEPANTSPPSREDGREEGAAGSLSSAGALDILELA
jgi:hypothetical protein